MRTFERPSISLDGEWRFVPDPERLHGPGQLPEGEPIAVPGCWEAQVDRPYRIITAWYRRTFDIPADWDGAPVLVRFNAVMYRCRVWLNGRAIGAHEGGYTEFVLDASEAVRPGARNEIVVEVVNPLNAISEYPAFSVDRVLLAEEWTPDLPLSTAPHGKQTWYSSQSGIWGSVCVERASDPRLEGVRVLPDLPGARATVRWTLGGGDTERGGLVIDARLTDPDGSEVASARVQVAEGAVSGSFDIDVPSPRAWDIGQPELYHVRLWLMRGTSALDAVTARFGMRSIEARDGRILLNGRPIYLLGALDQDIYPDTISTPPSRAFLEDQFQKAQQMGLNLLRCHIKVPDPSYLEVADEVGILVWCELPNWTTFSASSANRGEQTLRDMVEAMGNHPSIVIWTIINEDWGTELRYEARDRQWLLGMYDWLKELDPTRLVVDNSPCETPQTPNFHLRTDLADFHIYFIAPDNAIRWTNWVTEFARRPAWLWSPHGDAQPTGTEPLVLSEFGSWGLPRIDRLVSHYERQPWWFGTGLVYYRPAGIRRRFDAYGLGRVWEDVDALAEATQWHQFEGLQFEVGEIRRHDSIQGYVITEFTDATWEANGLLDIARHPKAYHDRLAALNAPDVVVPQLERRDLAAGSAIRVPLWVSSFGAPSDGGTIRWQLLLGDGQRVDGDIAVRQWPAHGAACIGEADISVPTVDRTVDGRLVLTLLDADGGRRGGDEFRLAVLPPTQADRALRVGVNDPEEIWGIAARIRALGHDVVPWEDAEVLVTSDVDARVVDHADAGGRVLVLVRTRTAVPDGIDLARRVNVHLRRLPHAGWPGQRSPWEGDWVTSFSWMLPETFDGLPDRNPLDFAYGEVLPDHVLLGHDPARHADEVSAGMFVGWVHTPAAIEWSFPQGAGRVTLTTFRLSPEAGPVASALFQRLLRRTSEPR